MQLLGTKVCKKHDLGVHNNVVWRHHAQLDRRIVAGHVNEVCHCPPWLMTLTLKMEEVLFKSPVKENNLIKIYGQMTASVAKASPSRSKPANSTSTANVQKMWSQHEMVFTTVDEVDGKTASIRTLAG